MDAPPIADAGPGPPAQVVSEVEFRARVAAAVSLSSESAMAMAMGSGSAATVGATIELDGQVVRLESPVRLKKGSLIIRGGEL